MFCLLKGALFHVLLQDMVRKEQYTTGLEQDVVRKEQFTTGLEQNVVRKEQYTTGLDQEVVRKEQYTTGLGQEVIQNVQRVTWQEQKKRDLEQGNIQKQQETNQINMETRERNLDILTSVKLRECGIFVLIPLFLILFITLIIIICLRFF